MYIFKNALKSTDDKEKLKNEQKDWLKYDRNNCEGVECLEEAYNNQIEFGLTYRKQDSFGGMVNINITPQLRIGYAYDRIISNLKYTTNSSHEIILLFDLINYKKVSRSPRFF